MTSDCQSGPRCLRTAGSVWGRVADACHRQLGPFQRRVLQAAAQAQAHAVVVGEDGRVTPAYVLSPSGPSAAWSSGTEVESRQRSQS